MDNSINAGQYTRFSLREIVAHYQNIRDGNEVKFWQIIAGELSKAVKQEPPWSWRYPQGVDKGTIEPSKKFSKAVELVGAAMDGIPIALADVQQIMVYANPENVKADSIVMGVTKVCAEPGCNRLFVPNVPWRKKCPGCSPPR